MTPAKAAAQWLEADAAYKAAERDRDEAAKILKAHFRAKGTTEYRGVRYACSSYTQLDSALARALLGKRASEAEQVRTRETLSRIP